jgi:hypothetical protein
LAHLEKFKKYVKLQLSIKYLLESWFFCGY